MTRGGTLGWVAWAALLLGAVAARAASAGRELVLQYGYAGPVPCLVFSPDGSLLASAGTEDHTVRIWDTRTWDLLRVARGYGDSAQGLAFCAGGRLVTYAGRTNQVELWNPRTGDRLKPLGEPSGNRIEGLTASADGATVAVCYGDGRVALWDVVARRERNTFRPNDPANEVLPGGLGIPAPPTRPAGALALSPDSSRLLVAMSNRAAWVLDAAGGQRVRELPAGSEPIRAVRFSPDGRLAAAGDMSGCVRLWDAESGEPRGLLPSQAPLGFWIGDTFVLKSEWKGAMPGLGPRSGRYVGSFDFSPDGTRIATGSGTGETLLWDASAQRILWRSPGSAARVGAVAFSPDGRLVARAAADEEQWRDGEIRILEARTGRVLHALWGQSDWERAGAFSRDGRFLVRAAEGPTLVVWDLHRGALRTAIRVRGRSAEAPVFSSDGGRIAAIVDGAVVVWALPRASGYGGKSERRGREITAREVTFEADGRTVLAVCGRYPQPLEVRRFGPHGRRSRVRLVGKPLEVMGLSAGGRWLAGMEGDGVSYLWNTRTGIRRRLPDLPAALRSGGLQTEFRFPERLLVAALSPDGQTVALQHTRGGIHLFDVRTGKLGPRLGEPDQQGSDAQFSEDSQSLWTIQEQSDGLLRIRKWKTASGALLGAKELRAGPRGSFIDDRTFCPRTGRLVWKRLDGTLEVWDFRSGRKLGELHHFARGDRPPLPEAWLAVTPGGDYAGSPGAAHSVRWVTGTRVGRASVRRGRSFGRQDRVAAAFGPSRNASPRPTGRRSR